MDNQKISEHPHKLTPGDSYLYRQNLNGKPGYTAVVFLDYTPCPAVVIIRDENGRYLRCGRDSLFTAAT